MIAKKFRLPRQRFSERPASRIGSDYFLVKIFKNDLSHNRFGVVISTKADKRSSRRNFWRRTILNYARQLIESEDSSEFIEPEGSSEPERPERQISFGKDLLIIVSPRIRELSKSGVEQELGKMFKRCYEA